MRELTLAKRRAGARRTPRGSPRDTCSTAEKVFIKSFWKSQFPHKSVNSLIKSFCKRQFPHTFFNVSFLWVMIKDKLTDLCGNWHLQNNCINTFCGIRLGPTPPKNRPQPGGVRPAVGSYLTKGSSHARVSSALLDSEFNFPMRGTYTSTSGVTTISRPDLSHTMF